MKVFATIAIAAAVRLNAEETEEKYDVKSWPSASAIWTHCNTDKNGVLDAGEVVACLKKSGMKFEDAVRTADHLLKYAHLPASALGPVPKGVSAFTGGKVSAKEHAAAIVKCDTDGSKTLSYKETAACLKKHAAALGLTSEKKWTKAKWALAQAAVLDKKSFKAAYKAAKTWAAKQ